MLMNTSNLSYPTRRRNKSARRHYLADGTRAAALRAFTAARLYLAESGMTLTGAAAVCGSNLVYVQAAVVLLKHADSELIDAVLKGTVPILEAAAKVKPVVALTTAYQVAGSTDRVIWARREGAHKIFDDAIAPAIA